MKDAVLIADKSRTQEIKLVVDQLIKLDIDKAEVFQKTIAMGLV